MEEAAQRGLAPDDATPDQPSPATEATTGAAASQIDLSRRVVPVVDMSGDVCSICLDEFSEDDPAQMTNCEHPYHLQCIMQWAQRSRECPMCFKHLQMQEDSLNDLLPFGEYRPPEQDTPPSMLMGMDALELDRLLARLAVGGGGSQGRRSSRAARHAARAARHAQQAAAAEAAAGGAVSSSAGHERAGSGASSASPIDMQRGGGGSEGYPASWPPANHSRTVSRVSGSEAAEGAAGSPATDLRTRWASRAKATLSNTTKELRSFWGRAASAIHDPGDGGNGGGNGGGSSASSQRHLGNSGSAAS